MAVVTAVRGTGLTRMLETSNFRPLLLDALSKTMSMSEYMGKAKKMNLNRRI